MKIEIINSQLSAYDEVQGKDYCNSFDALFHLALKHELEWTYMYLKFHNLHSFKFFKAHEKLSQVDGLSMQAGAEALLLALQKIKDIN